jgi:molybdopterin converting factor small subunit
MTDPVTVRMFGALHTLRREQGLPTTVTVDVPAQGTTGRSLAVELGLPPEMIEGVFVNRTVFALDHPVNAGDRVAFVPYGTPGPHRVYLGLYRAGRGDGDAG